jgi:surfeit locus 1 family protein
MTSRLPFRFHPPWWAIALAAAGCAAGIVLGNWQAGRADEKRLAAAFVQKVVLKGEFVSRYTVLLDNKLHRGRPGYHVVQPLRIADTDKHVLVNRGWVASRERRELMPVFRTPSGVVTLEGIRQAQFARAYAPPGTPVAGPVMQNVTVEEFAGFSRLALEPWVFEQHSALDDGLLREWPRADAGVEKHESYALQWYSLAVLSLILFFVLNLKIEKRKS